jgi:RHS repeat-associated protein
MPPGTPDPGPVGTNNPITFDYVIGEAPSDENQTKQCDLKTGCSTCSTEPMASYSIHLMLASLHIEDTPISYNSPRGPSTHFKVTYNQREANQPTTFAYSNLGPKWTFNWLSYVTDNGPAAASASPTVYVRGGGTEVFSGFDSGTKSYAPDRQTLAVLVRTSGSTYEKNFPNGSKEVFSQSDGSSSYPRRIFLTSVVDATGNATTLTYDGSFRITTITDSLGQSTSLTYGLLGDPSKITKVTDPFERFATFEYTSGKLTKITDPVGIESAFGYASGSDFIDWMTTPSGTSTFAKGESGNLIRWLEATDPRGATERVEYNIAAPNIVSTEASAPAGVYNNGLQLRNTLYWDKKAMADAPGDYAKAQLFHWLLTPDGKVSGIKHSEKKALESRVWYTYPAQIDPAKVGSNALPTRIARILDGGVTQLSQYRYNEIGNPLTETDPIGRVKSYLYDTNNVDVLEVYQRNLAGPSLDPDGQHADKIAAYTYNSLHEPLTETDVAGQVTTYAYNTSGQILTRTNAKHETTKYTYGDIAPAGYLASITGPPFNDVSAATSFGYDGFNRVRTVTNEADHYTVTTDYDNLDRKVMVTYPDTTYEQFQYIDNVTGVMTLDLTGSRDRLGRWTYRHYDSNRKRDSMTDPLGRTTLYGWCACGSLNSITDPNRNVTTFNRDLQSRVYQKVFADSTTINYLFEGQTAPNTPGAASRLKSSTDALNRRTNYSYSIDNNISQVSYSDSSGNPLSPATPSVDYTYDPNYNRVATMNDGTGLTTYAYYPVGSSPTLGAGKLESLDGPLANDTITFTYDELGRTLSQSIDGVDETAAYDSLGRLTSTRNALGHFERDYEGVTPRLHMLTYPNGQTTNYSYYGNDHDRRLQTLQNMRDGGANLSKLDYTYNAEGRMTSWGKLLGTTSSGLWFDYDNAQQLVSARNASNPSRASQRYDFGYDDAGNRMRDSGYDLHQDPFSGSLHGTFTTYTANELNQLNSRAVQLNNGAPLWSELIYDLAGNLTDDGELTTFEWDAANRLRAISYPGNKRSEFTYDGLGRRVQIVEKTDSTVTGTKKFVWIGTGIAQERDASNAITRSYFAEGEQRGSPGTTGAQNYYYTRDHLGSIREVTNSTGAVQARYDYDPYGKRIKLSGTVDVDFGYTGHYHHAPSNLDLTLYRAYDSALGRWISRDPIGESGGLNLYEYVQNDPLNAIDPVGLFRVYGNWCGGDWTGGHKESYTPHSLDYYRSPQDQLDSACKTHDLCYYQCRKNYPCSKAQRSGCFRDCDTRLAMAADAIGGFWGRTIALAIDRPGKRDPEPDDSSCCQTGK